MCGSGIPVPPRGDDPATGESGGFHAHLLQQLVGRQNAQGIAGQRAVAGQQQKERM
jgi:hypothetical protein